MDQNQFLNMNNMQGLNYNQFDQFNQQPLAQQPQQSQHALQQQAQLNQHSALQQNLFNQHTTGNDHITQLAQQIAPQMQTATSQSNLFASHQNTGAASAAPSTTNHLQKLQQMQMMAQLQQY